MTARKLFYSLVPVGFIETDVLLFVVAMKNLNQDRRVASRQTPYFFQRQKSMQKGLLLRRALLSRVVGVLFSYKVD
jgi:hypothetical protein